MYKLIVGEIPQTQEKALYKILEEIKISNFTWCISEDEAYLENNEDLFISSIFKGDKFSNIIAENNYYIINLIAKAYEEDDIAIIKSIDDFMNSKCKILILIVDVTHIEVYVKDTKMAQILFNNMNKYEFNPRFISDENYRKTFDIW